MKKKAILGFMTGAAIVAATTGSYAAWDKLTATASDTLSLRKPISLTAQNLKIVQVEDAGKTPVVTATLPLTVSDNAAGLTISAEPTVSIDGANVTDTDATVEKTIYKKGDDSKAAVTAVENNGEYVVEVTVTPKDSVSDKMIEGTAAGLVEVKVDAQLSAPTNS